MIHNTIIQDDALSAAQSLPDECLHMICTSPPYFGLRDYQLPPTDWPAVEYSPMAGLPPLSIEPWRGCLGLEPTPEMFVGHIVAVFRELRRALRKDGTAWVNFGDSYNSNSSGQNGTGKTTMKSPDIGSNLLGRSNKQVDTLKPKDLCMIPARVALALQADGWYLRSDIIWCLSGGVEVYAKTQKGQGPTTIKDLVRLDPSTVQLWNGEKWTQVLGWSESPRPDNPIEIELRSGEKITCTPNHQWPTSRGLLRADELQEGDIIETCRLPQPTPSNQPEFIPDDIGWLIGLYLAEGSKGKGGKVIQIASHASELSRFARLQEISEAYGATCRMHKTSGNGATINLYGSALIGVIDQYINGKTSHDKCLSPACWQRSDFFLREILSGYLDGDGHYDEPNDRWRLGFTRNYKLASNLRTICARLGVSIRLKLSTATNQNGTFKTFRGELRFNRSNHHNSKQDSEVVRMGQGNARKFWDIGVADEPHLFALSSGVLTHNSKKNPMPESVTDRPTKAHEYLFLLSKSARYFYDAEAVREEAEYGRRDWSHGRSEYDMLGTERAAHSTTGGDPSAGRNRRSVWDIATEPFPEAHFATFPRKLVEPCILAGTSARGCCPCGAPWARVVEREPMEVKPGPSRDERSENGRLRTQVNGTMVKPPTSITTGWQPTCNCPPAEPIPAVVYDPFMGSGTVAEVAVRHRRDYLGSELNPDYIELAQQRINGTQVTLF